MNENTSKNFTLLEEAVNSSAKIEVQSEFLLPDYIPDAEKMLMCVASPVVSEQNIGDGRIDFSGSIAFDVLLSCEEGALKGITFSEPFSGSVQASGVDGECFAEMIPTVASVSARLSSPRKLGIKSSISVASRIFTEKNISPVLEGISEADAELTTESDLTETEGLSILTSEAKGIRFSEDIELDGGDGQISEILLSRVYPEQSEVRISGGEAEVKTSFCLSVICEGEEGGYFTVAKRLSQTEPIPASGFPDGAECTAFVRASDPKLTVSENSYGERKLIELDFDYDITLGCFTNERLTVVRDMYSTECESTEEYKDITVLSHKRTHQTGASVNASKDRKEAGAENMAQILCGSTRISPLSVSEEGDRLFANGTLFITVVGSLAEETEGEKTYSSVSFEHPFKVELDRAGAEGYSCILYPSILGERYRLDSSSVFADIEVGVRSVSLGEKTVRCLFSLTADESKPKERSPFPMTLCYPNGRSLWEIAKSYKTTREEIRNANGIEGDLPKGVLLIPTQSKGSHSAKLL